MTFASVLRKEGPSEEMTAVDLRGYILSTLGYRTDWSYIPKAALNSLMAYKTGEFVYQPDRHDEFTREELLLMAGGDFEILSVIDSASADYTLRKSELLDLAVRLQEMEDQRSWTNG